MQGLNFFFKKASSHVIEKELPRSLLTSFDCLLGYIINRHNISSWPENGMEGYSARTLPSPPDVEQIELETPSVRESVTSWVSCCDTGLDLPQRKSHRKVCINTILPPYLEGSTVPLRVSWQNYGGYRWQQVNINVEQDLILQGCIQDCSSWLLTDTKCSCPVEGKEFFFNFAPRWLIALWEKSKILSATAPSKIAVWKAFSVSANLTSFQFTRVRTS